MEGDSLDEMIAKLERRLEAMDRARQAHQACAATLRELVAAQSRIIEDLLQGGDRIERLAQQILGRR